MYHMAFPLVYQQGPGLLQEIGTLTAVFGRRPLVVLDGFIQQQYGQAVFASLSAAGLTPELFLFSGEICPEQIETLVARARDTACDFAIGLGGGKVLDAAKTVKLELGLPVVIMPTIASNDAPTSRLIITYHSDGTFRGPLILPENPNAVLVDTAVIAAAPKRFLVAGMGDALATWFEASQCHQSGVLNFLGGRPGETVLALARLCHDLIRQYGEAALQALEQKKSTEALEKVVEANVLLSGLGFEGCGVAAAHAFTQGFTQIPALHGHLHGEEVAVGLIAQLALENRSDALICELLDFYRRIGLPSSLADLGLPAPSAEQLHTIATYACRPGSRMHNMAFPVRVEAATTALQRAITLAANH